MFLPSHLYTGSSSDQKVPAPQYWLSELRLMFIILFTVGAVTTAAPPVPTTEEGTLTCTKKNAQIIAHPLKLESWNLRAFLSRSPSPYYRSRHRSYRSRSRYYFKSELKECLSFLSRRSEENDVIGKVALEPALASFILHIIKRKEYSSWDANVTKFLFFFFRSYSPRRRDYSPRYRYWDTGIPTGDRWQCPH